MRQAGRHEGRLREGYTASLWTTFATALRIYDYSRTKSPIVNVPLGNGCEGEHEGKSGGRGDQRGGVELNRMRDYGGESRGVILSWETGCSFVE